MVPEVRVRDWTLVPEGDGAYDRLRALFTRLLLALPRLRAHGRQRHATLRYDEHRGATLRPVRSG